MRRSFGLYQSLSPTFASDFPQPTGSESRARANDSWRKNSEDSFPVPTLQHTAYASYREAHPPPVLLAIRFEDISKSLPGHLSLISLCALCALV